MTWLRVPLDVRPGLISPLPLRLRKLLWVSSRLKRGLPAPSSGLRLRRLVGVKALLASGARDQREAGGSLPAAPLERTPLASESGGCGSRGWGASRSASWMYQLSPRPRWAAPSWRSLQRSTQSALRRCCGPLSACPVSPRPRHTLCLGCGLTSLPIGWASSGGLRSDGKAEHIERGEASLYAGGPLSSTILSPPWIQMDESRGECWLWTRGAVDHAHLLACLQVQGLIGASVHGPRHASRPSRQKVSGRRRASFIQHDP